MTDVVTGLGAGFEGAEVKSSFGSSSDLARQIEKGAPADVYISASRKWIDYLKDKDLLDGEAITFARGSLVCIVPEASDLDAADVAYLIALLKGNDKVAIANEGVPAGDYARQSLQATGWLRRLTPWLVGQLDVRDVLRAVASGECAAGFVYSTDARAADVRVLFTFDPATHDPIEYFAAVVKGCANSELAHKYVAYLGSGTARDVLIAAGFTLP